MFLNKINPVKIGIDIDDTLCNFHEVFIDYVNTLYSQSYNYEAMTVYDYDNFLNFNDVQHVFDQFIRCNMVPKLEPFKNAFECLKKLKNSIYCELHLITSRDDRLSDITSEWINKYFPDIFHQEIHYCNEFNDNNNFKTEKVNKCKLLGINILLDDRLSHILKCTENISNFYGILYRQPWNKSYENMYNNILSMDWSNDFVDIIKTIIKRLNINNNNKKPIVIGISGKLGSGKDTTAVLIKEMVDINFEIKSFALRLKEVVSVLTHTTLLENQTQEGKGLIPVGFDYSLGYLQQILGEGLRKLIDDKIWINVLLSNIMNTKIIISDTRYKNEANEIREKGGIIIRINGDPENIRLYNKTKRNLNHPTENDLDDYAFDMIINNNETVLKLKERLYYALIPYIYSCYI